MRVRLVIAAAALAAAPALGEGRSELEAPARMEAGREPIDGEIGHAAPFFGDLDPRLGCGDGSVQRYRSLGSATEHRLGGPETLARPGAQEARAKRAGFATRAKLHAADWNGDGRVDPLLGDFSSDGLGKFHGHVRVFLRDGVAAATAKA
jgi:hypothetical protein